MIFWSSILDYTVLTDLKEYFNWLKKEWLAKIAFILLRTAFRFVKNSNRKRLCSCLARNSESTSKVSKKVSWFWRRELTTRKFWLSYTIVNRIQFLLNSKCLGQKRLRLLKRQRKKKNSREKLNKLRKPQSLISKSLWHQSYPRGVEKF